MADKKNTILCCCCLVIFCSCTSVTTSPVPVENRSKAAEVEDLEADSTGFVQPALPSQDNVNRAGMPSAIVALLDQAQGELEDGDSESASATLERAVRIDAKNPYVWNRLARVRLSQAQWQQALNLARRSNSLAAGNYDLQMENWRIILEVKQVVRDAQGVEEARRMIDRLRSQVSGSRS